MSKVYFIGAGATKAVKGDAPLNNELLEYIFKSLNNPNTENDINELERFLENFFYKNNYKFYPNIEDVLSFVDNALYSSGSYFKDYNHSSFHNIKNCIIKLIAISLKETLGGIGKNITDEFCKKLNEGDTIISTNYDILVDDALFRTKKSLNYGVKLRNNIFPLSGIAEGTVGNYDMVQLNQGNVNLLKLHGSLNWVYCEKCQEIDISVGEKIIIDYWPGQKKTLTCLNPYCTSLYTPLIISPSYLKNYDNRVITEIWSKAEKNIASAEELIFIGYSLPKPDILIKNMLIGGLNKPSKKPEITVIDIEEKVEDNYRKLFGKLDFKPIGFESYIKNEMD